MFDKVFFGGLFLLFTAATLAAAVFGVFELLVDNVSKASDYAAFSSGLASIGLVVITGAYTYLTQQLVRSNEEARAEERQARDTRRERERNHLRRALLKEIQAIEGLRDLGREYEISVSFYRQLVPTQVYETNSANLGQLTEGEIDSVVEYYTTAQILNELLRMQRRLDTHIERSLFEQVYYYISFMWLMDRRARNERKEQIKNRLDELADAQSEATEALKSQLDSVEDS